MEDNNQYEKEISFDAYLRGEMSPSEKEMFEGRLATDDLLREEFEFFSAASEGLHINRLRREFRQRYDEAKQEIDSHPNPPTHWKHYLLGMALLLAGFAAGWLLGKDEGDKSTPKSVQVPTGPVAQQGEEEDEPIVGAGRKISRFKTPIKPVSISTDSLEIVLVEGSEQKAELERKVLAIQYLPGQMPDANTIQLLELELAGRKVLYLKMEGKFYPIREGKQGFVEEMDDVVLEWLQKKD